MGAEGCVGCVGVCWSGATIKNTVVDVDGCRYVCFVCVVCVHGRENSRDVMHGIGGTRMRCGGVYMGVDGYRMLIKDAGTRI